MSDTLSPNTPNNDSVGWKNSRFGLSFWGWYLLFSVGAVVLGFRLLK